mmetsp:Transcript_40678/g.127260  ORF Transcript_40678/g.127260 Transcript_40678/m.127260 type:complete len:490 (-) Transcript_40678:482-1951(-)
MMARSGARNARRSKQGKATPRPSVTASLRTSAFSASRASKASAREGSALFAPSMSELSLLDAWHEGGIEAVDLRSEAQRRSTSDKRVPPVQAQASEATGDDTAQSIKALCAAIQGHTGSISIVMQHKMEGELEEGDGGVVVATQGSEGGASNGVTIDLERPKAEAEVGTGKKRAKGKKAKSKTRTRLLRRSTREQNEAETSGTESDHSVQEPSVREHLGAGKPVAQEGKTDAATAEGAAKTAGGPDAATAEGAAKTAGGSQKKPSLVRRKSSRKWRTKRKASISRATITPKAPAATQRRASSHHRAPLLRQKSTTKKGQSVSPKPGLVRLQSSKRRGSSLCSKKWHGDEKPLKEGDSGSDDVDDKPPFLGQTALDVIGDEGTSSTESAPSHVTSGALGDGVAGEADEDDVDDEVVTHRPPEWYTRERPRTGIESNRARRRRQRSLGGEGGVKALPLSWWRNFAGLVPQTPVPETSAATCAVHGEAGGAA